MNVKTELIIFDLDGVLIDSEPLHDEVFHSIIHSVVGNKKIEALHYIGISNVELYNIFLADYPTSKTAEELSDLHYERVLDLIYDRDVNVMIGVQKLLQDLKRREIPYAVASSSPRKFVESVLEKLGILNDACTIVTGSDVNKLKPEPDIYLKVLEMTGVPALNTIALEDSYSGVKAAKLTGITCVAFHSPGSGEQDLSLADAHIYKIEDMITLLKV